MLDRCKIGVTTTSLQFAAGKKVLRISGKLGKVLMRYEELKAGMYMEVEEKFEGYEI